MVVWTTAMFIIAVTAHRSRRSTGKIVPSAGYLRMLGLITYPLYLTHNVVGEAIVRALIHIGLDATLQSGQA